MIYLIFLCTFISIPFPRLSYADFLMGGFINYTVVKGDTIELISSKLGVDRDRLILDNNLDPNRYLQIGSVLKVNTMKIVPKVIDSGIIINIPDRMLYYFRDGLLEFSTPVGLGMPSWRGSRQWRTPEGDFKIVSKRKNPSWRVPISMQRKMEKEGQPVKIFVPPGPDNPLGRYALDTSISGIIIHETIWPTSVYRYRSHGCIRVLPENMEQLFNLVKVGTKGKIIYQPIKIAVMDKKVYLEVNRDIYKKLGDLRTEVEKLIQEKGLSRVVNWAIVERMLKEQSGVAEEITLGRSEF
ncbi:MAG: L,D-transpeptidase family protein [Thermodesulfovibrionales bacterium]|nr:L,D-transpeptidase family protein [Thermodesulfovibrionales bacterium]